MLSIGHQVKKYALTKRDVERMKVRDKQKKMNTPYKYMLKQKQCLFYSQIVTHFRYDRDLSVEAPS